MTGYGRAQGHFEKKTITVEIRSLNGKSTDIRCKLPHNYKEKELALRKIVLDSALRGKFDLTITTDDNGTISEVGINKALFTSYYNQLKDLENDLGLSPTDYVQSILRIPNVIQADESGITDEEWEVLQSVTKEAIQNLINFREIDGKAAAQDLEECINNIKSFHSNIGEHLAPRLDHLKEKLQKIVEDYSQNTNLDQNRMEQEVLFYMEKMDINEERVRLDQHCDYFLEELAKADPLKGRKLSFISQEIGREINTMGAKAQYTPIQKMVVKMKNDLEKIKEQLANIV